jgi:hypothetical protein
MERESIDKHEEEIIEFEEEVERSLAQSRRESG